MVGSSSVIIDLGSIFSRILRMLSPFGAFGARVAIGDDTVEGPVGPMATPSVTLGNELNEIFFFCRAASGGGRCGTF